MCYKHIGNLGNLKNRIVGYMDLHYKTKTAVRPS